MSTTALLTDTEAAKLLRMTPDRLNRLARRGKAPCVALPDGQLRYDHDDLMEWVNRYKRPSTVTEDQR